MAELSSFRLCGVPIIPAGLPQTADRSDGLQPCAALADSGGRLAIVPADGGAPPVFRGGAFFEVYDLSASGRDGIVMDFAGKVSPAAF